MMIAIHLGNFAGTLGTSVNCSRAMARSTTALWNLIYQLLDSRRRHTRKSSREFTDWQTISKPELQRIERDNLLLALEATNWKIKGPDGAAELFGIKPSTLLAKLKKCDLKKPE